MRIFIYTAIIFPATTLCMELYKEESLWGDRFTKNIPYPVAQCKIDEKYRNELEIIAKNNLSINDIDKNSKTYLSKYIMDSYEINPAVLREYFRQGACMITKQPEKTSNVLKTVVFGKFVDKLKNNSSSLIVKKEFIPWMGIIFRERISLTKEKYFRLLCSLYVLNKQRLPIDKIPKVLIPLIAQEAFKDDEAIIDIRSCILHKDCSLEIIKRTPLFSIIKGHETLFTDEFWSSPIRNILEKLNSI